VRRRQSSLVRQRPFLLVASARHALAYTACVLAVANTLLAQTTDTPPLFERLGLEGPLDNDTRVPTCQPAADELARGDAEWARATSDPTRASDDSARASQESARTAAFEAWRRALIESGPRDVVAANEPTDLDARTESVSAAVARRVEHASRAAFVARFEAPARAALDAARDDLDALERVVHEGPFTRAAARAALRRCDVLLERGERARARAALNARGVAEACADDPTLSAARAKRLEFLLRARTPAPAPDARSVDAFGRVTTLTLPDVSEADVSRRLEPGIAFEVDAATHTTRAWLHVGERLVRVTETADVAPRVDAWDTRDLARPFDASWLPGFGDRARPWDQTPACADGRLVLVVGRAREERGNALLVLDTASDDEAPRARWCLSDSGFARVDGVRATAAECGFEGRLEFQPGPISCEELVIAQVLQWTRTDARGVARVDESDTIAWLVAFDVASGDVVWRREWARGADRTARDAARMSDPRGVSSASLPLAIEDDVVTAVTELGVAGSVRAGDGDWLGGRRLRRAPRVPRPATFDPRAEAQAEPPVRGGVAHRAFATTDAGEFVYESTWDGGARPRHVDGLVRPVDAHGTSLCRRGDRLLLARPAADGRPEAESLPFPRGASVRGLLSTDAAILCATGSELVAYDPRRDLMRTAAVPLEGLDQEPFCGLQVRGRWVYVVGLRRAWRVEIP